MPTCTICNQIKEVSEFYTLKSGKIHKPCKICCRINKSQYYKNNKEKPKIKAQKYKELNSEKIKIDRKKYYQDNKERIRADQYNYHNTPKGRLISLMTLAEARSVGKDFDLNIDFLLDLYNKQDGKCSLTKIDFSFQKPKNFRTDPFAVSIDKINAKLFYTKDNIRLVSVAVNFALNEFGEDIFKVICVEYIKNILNNKEKNV